MLLQKKNRPRGQVEREDLWLDRVSGNIDSKNTDLPIWLMPDDFTEFKIYVGTSDDDDDDDQ